MQLSGWFLQRQPLKQGTGNIEQSGNVEHSRSNAVESINNDKDTEQSTNNDKDIEQSTSNIVQSNINVQQSIDVVISLVVLILSKILK